MCIEKLIKVETYNNFIIYQKPMCDKDILRRTQTENLVKSEQSSRVLSMYLGKE